VWDCLSLCRFAYVIICVPFLSERNNIGLLRVPPKPNEELIQKSQLKTTKRKPRSTQRNTVPKMKLTSGDAINMDANGPGPYIPMDGTVASLEAGETVGQTLNGEMLALTANPA
jgi:hypothetical protein